MAVECRCRRDQNAVKENKPVTHSEVTVKGNIPKQKTKCSTECCLHSPKTYKMTKKRLYLRKKMFDKRFQIIILVNYYVSTQLLLHLIQFSS